MRSSSQRETRPIEVVVDRLRRDAGAKGRRQVALLERRVVAVPVELHAAPGPLLEHGREVGRADPLARGQILKAVALEEELVGIEGIDPPRSPGRLPGQQRHQPRAAHDEPLAYPGDDVEAPELLLEPADLGPGLAHGRDQPVGREPLVGPGVEEEAEEAVEVEIVGRHRRHEVARAVRLLAYRAGMTDGAVEPGKLDPVHLTPADPDRQVALFAVGPQLVEEAEGLVVGPVLELLGEETRQRLPDPIGKPVLLRADRAVLEMLDDVGLVRCPVLEQAPDDVAPGQDGQKTDDDQNPGKPVKRASEPAPAAQSLLHGADGLFPEHG